MVIKKYECRVYLFCLYVLCKMSPKEIAKELGIKRDVIYTWLKKFNIKREKSYINKEWLYKQYIELEMSPKEIGKK